MISTFWSYQTVQPSFMSKWQQSNSSGFLNVMQWFQCHALFSLKRATVQISPAAPPAGVQQPFTHCTGLTQKNYSDYSMLPQLQKNLSLHKCYFYTQCAPGFFNPNQKVHGIFHFYVEGLYKTDQNQFEKPSVIRLPKFTSVDMTKKCHQRLSFSKENPFFEDYCFGSLLTDGFFN